jgi:Tol biopolymer transport system component
MFPRIICGLIGIFLLFGCSPGIEVVFLRPQNDWADIWILQGEEVHALTETDGQIYDFSVAPDGKSLIYSRLNDSGGMDLWQLPLNGQTAQRLLVCGADWCQAGILSPDGGWLVYSRSEFSNHPPGSVQPRIWTLDIATSRTAPLYNGVFVAGEEPSLSPDGAYLAFYDPQARGIRVVELSSGNSQFLPTDFASESWSSDGRQMVFVELRSLRVEEVVSRLVIVDLATQNIHPLSTNDQTQIDYSVPALSPDGVWLAVGWRYAGGPPGKQLKLLNVETGQELVIAEDLTYSHTAYHWSSESSMLVFQRIKIDDSRARPEVWVWERASNSSRLLVDDAALPQNLP